MHCGRDDSKQSLFLYNKSTHAVDGLQQKTVQCKESDCLLFRLEVEGLEKGFVHLKLRVVVKAREPLSP